MRLAYIFPLLMISACAPLFGSVQDSLMQQSSEVNEVHTPAPQGSLESIINSFLNAHAGDHAPWRCNVTTANVSEFSLPSPGFQKGQSASGLWFEFQAKTSDMLTPEERRQVLRDPRFGPFISQMRKLADEGIPPQAPQLKAAAEAPKPELIPKTMGRAEMLARLLKGRRPPPDAIHFEITADELILPGPIVITHQSRTNP